MGGIVLVVALLLLGASLVIAGVAALYGFGASLIAGGAFIIAIALVLRGGLDDE
jgi:hypothetical protein